MVTTRIVAGLANQMHQYAFGRAISLERNEELFLDIDSFYYDTREYELGIFNIDAKIATKKQKPRYLILWKQPLLDKLRYPVARIAKKINPHHIIENPLHPKIHAGMFDYQSQTVAKARSTQGDIYLEGFWHSEKYFKKHESTIREDFTLKKPISDEKNVKTITCMESCNSVSIHVRRGDYAGTYYEGICGMHYYKSAIDYMKTHTKDPKFFVLSDDIDWCKQEFKDYDIEEYVENGGNSREKNSKIAGIEKHGADAYKNMILMSHCKHNIIANSTFSRRGARLNINPEKIVIAPKKWHANLDYKDIIPTDWIRL